MNDAIIRAEKLTKTYKLLAEEIRAIRDIDLEVKGGEFLAVMGPSGSGKTTLLDTIGCLTTVTQGKLFILGKDVSEAKERELVSVRRKFISFIFQDFLLISSLTALENCLMPLYFSGLAQDRNKAVALLESVGLGKRINHLPAQLSGGEKQRVAIARALVTSPKLLLADEPTGNLDSKTSQEIADILARLNRDEGLTIIMTTHNPKLGQQAKRTLLLQDGRIVS